MWHFPEKGSLEHVSPTTHNLCLFWVCVNSEILLVRNIEEDCHSWSLLYNVYITYKSKKRAFI